MIETHEFSDRNWGACLSANNDQVELNIPFEFGPSILRCQFKDEENCFAEFPAHKTDPDSGKWHSFGGHRLWHGPEDIVRTYLPDNDPVQVEILDSTILIQQKIEPRTQLQKEMEIRLAGSGAQVQITHRIRNHNLFELRMALWAISVMATQGRAIIPLPARGTHDGNLQAQTSLNLWAYTDLQDSRWQIGKKYISFRQDPAISDPQKIGISSSGGWLAYINAGHTFLKKCAYIDQEEYPDQGSAFEVYADHKCVEMESLGPLTTIEPGGFATLVEDWILIKGIVRNSNENELDQHLACAFI